MLLKHMDFSVHLFNHMKKFENHGCKVVYCDTDSILVEYDIEKGLPVETGSMLGMLENQYPNHDIQEFIASGSVH